MRADTAWDVADSAASRCSAHKTVGARADAAAIDVSRKKWRRDGAELITFFIVQPCDGARRRASAGRGAQRSRTLDRRYHPIGTSLRTRSGVTFRGFPWTWVFRAPPSRLTSDPPPS